MDAAREALERGVVGSLAPVDEDQLAAVLGELVPWGESVRFLKTGAEAVAAAVRLARVATNRDRVLGCGYHGWLDLGSREPGVPEPVRDLYQPLPFNDSERSRELIREVPIASHVRDFASSVVMATHPEWEHSPDITRRFVRYGASPRGGQALVLGAKVRALCQGRFNVSIEDLKALAAPALRHRVILNFEGEAEAVDTDTMIGDIMENVEQHTAQGKEPFLR